MVALLDKLIVYKTRRDIGAAMSQIVQSLNTRVSRLETEVGASAWCGA
jgi:hypothetical protein